MPSLPADRERARAQYERLAARYDWRLAGGRLLHRRAVAALDPAPGATVLDVGCGTGLAFGSLQERIGPSGEIVGVELSPAMLERARARVDQNSWTNVELLNAPAQELRLSQPADAALLVLTHDLMTSRDALAAVVAAVRPGGRVAAAGARWAPRWALPVNAYVWLKARRYVTTFAMFDQPWALLAELVPHLQVKPLFAGAAYVASGSVPLDVTATA